MNEIHELPIHPRTGLQALGVGRRGPIWPVMGGAEDGAAGESPTDSTQEQSSQEQDQGGGAGNAGESGPKRDPLYADLPDDHPLVKRHEALKAENKVLRPKAKQVDDAEEAKKTDAQKIAELTKSVEGVPAAVAGALRDHLVDLHGIDKDDAELFLTGDTPELLLKQVSRLLDQSGGGSKRRNHVPREGNPHGRPKPDETREFVRSITADRGQ